MNHVVSSCARMTNRVLRPLGVRVMRARNLKPDQNTLDSALDRLGGLALGIQTIVDVGASNGCWSRQAQRVFPHAQILAFEPLEERWPELDQWRQSDPRVRVVKGVAGASRGAVPFHVAADLDGSGISEDRQAGRELPVTSIDHEVAQANHPTSFLIKLDTHGYEVPILEGAAETLQQTQALIIEVYNFQLTSSSLRFHEMCAQLATLGFRCFDIFDICRRTADHTLWQADFAFIRDDHPVFQNTSFR